MKGMKKVKENAVREVKKKEIKKSEGEEANDRLKEIKELIKKEMLNEGDREAVKEMAKEMKEMRKSMDFMSSKFEECMTEMKEMREELSNMKKEKEELKKEMNEMRNTLNESRKERGEIEGKFLIMQNEQLQENLEFVGLPCSDQEKCRDLALNLARKVDPSFKTGDIIDAYRIGNPKDKDGKVKTTRPLLVKFATKRVRNFLYRNKKNLRASGEENGGKMAGQRFFINENLCRDSKALFRKANELKKEKEYKYIWSSYGTIYLRKDDKEKHICIKCTDDLAQII